MTTQTETGRFYPDDRETAETLLGVHIAKRRLTGASEQEIAAEVFDVIRAAYEFAITAEADPRVRGELDA